LARHWRPKPAQQWRVELHDPVFFFQLLLPTSTGLAARMKTKFAQHRRDVKEAISLRCQSQKEFKIQGEVQALVEPISLFKHTASEEGRRGGYVKNSVIQQDKRTEFNFVPNSKYIAILADPRVIAVNNIHFWMLLKNARYIPETTSTIAIIRVQPSYDLAMGFCKPLV
jgi:hypothetical protein